MKKLALALILAAVLTLTFATPAFAGPPPDAGKGTAWNDNDGLGNAWNHLKEVSDKTGSAGVGWAWAIIDYLWYPEAGPPPWFVPALWNH